MPYNCDDEPTSIVKSSKIHANWISMYKVSKYLSNGSRLLIEVGSWLTIIRIYQWVITDLLHNESSTPLHADNEK